MPPRTLLSRQLSQQQPRLTESGTVYNKNYGSPINPAEQGSDTKPTPSSPDQTQPTK